MKSKLLLLIAPLLFATLALERAAPSPPPATAQRAIAITFSVDGEIVLRAGTSDDGSPDADAVWERAAALELRPTEAFAALQVPASESTLALGLLRGRATEHLGDPPLLELSVAYGGRTRLSTAELTRVSGTDRWLLAPETFERYFSIRSISRREAALLDRPERGR